MADNLDEQQLFDAEQLGLEGLQATIEAWSEFDRLMIEILS
jgi:hypothetical protein